MFYADLSAPIGDISRPLIYNQTFTLAPSPDTDKAWDDIFPTGKGFVKHPSIAPQLSGLAVFHQIHCVVCEACLPKKFSFTLTCSRRTYFASDIMLLWTEPFKN